MGSPAATISSYHTCPKSTGTKAHVGGPIVAGCGSVLIGGLPAARVGDKCACEGPADVISAGSPTVIINGKPAARMGDATAHGGKIMVGNPTVLIG